MDGFLKKDLKELRLEKFRPIFSSSSFAIRLNFPQFEPSLFLFGFWSLLWYFSTCTLLKWLFGRVSLILKPILHVANISRHKSQYNLLSSYFNSLQRGKYCKQFTGPVQFCGSLHAHRSRPSLNEILIIRNYGTSVNYNDIAVLLS